MLEYKRSNRPFFIKCWWCDEEFYTEGERFVHLYFQHPQFFEEFDKINGWVPFPFSTPNIPEKPDDLAEEGDSSC